MPVTAAHYLAALAGLVAWGAHAVVPWRLARAAEGPRRIWALAALPLLLAATAAAATVAAGDADTTLAAGWLDRPLAAAALRSVAVLLPALVLTDLLLLAAWRRLARPSTRAALRRGDRDGLEPAGWWIAGGLGAVALAALALAAELAARGGLPAGRAAGVVLAAAGCRVLLALAAGELVALSLPGPPLPPTARRRPLLALAAAPAVAGYWLALPSPVRERLAGEGFFFTALAAALLLLVGRWLPRRLRWPALAAAVLLATLLPARAAVVAVELTPPPRPPLRTTLPG